METWIGIMIPFLGTTIGAGFVFFLKEKVSDKLIAGFLALAAGIMVSASFFSLLLPALEANGENNIVAVTLGFMLGGVFLGILDKLLPHFHPNTNTVEGLPSHLKKSTMLILAVTLHNIPEGMAVGLLYGVALQSGEAAAFASALALSIGIAIQNIPEGAAIALPLKKSGTSNKKAFVYGTLSGIVEPLGALLAIAFVSQVSGIMPWFLSFAAGAMIYVVVEELIPEAQMDTHSDKITFVFMLGFAIMMVLDVVLG
ncbi:MAG: ZIP family metal transporter [Breznakia sp.]